MFSREESGPYRADEGVVDAVEELARLGDALLRRIVKLGPEHQPHGVADRHHAADARGGGCRTGLAVSKLLPLRMTIAPSRSA